jgi:hypothetical protein
MILWKSLWFSRYLQIIIEMDKRQKVIGTPNNSRLYDVLSIKDVFLYMATFLMLDNITTLLLCDKAILLLLKSADYKKGLEAIFRWRSSYECADYITLHISLKFLMDKFDNIEQPVHLYYKGMAGGKPHRTTGELSQRWQDIGIITFRRRGESRETHYIGGSTYFFCYALFFVTLDRWRCKNENCHSGILSNDSNPLV